MPTRLGGCSEPLTCAARRRPASPRRSWPGCCRGQRWTSRPRWTPSAPSARTYAAAAPSRCASTPPGSTASTCPPCGFRREALAAALAALEPECPGRAGRGARRARLGARGAAAGRDGHHGRAGGRRSPSGGCRSPGRPLRPGRPGSPIPSSVVMNVVPARWPASADRGRVPAADREYGGLPHPAVLAACALLGIDEVYAVGGAQAIAMFAYGTADCAPADLVTGPGNVYVTAAKRLLRGVVGIDAEAGPTEIAILADAHRRPGACRRRPDRPGRARPARRLPAGHHRSGLADAVDAELGAPGAGDPARERVTAALAGQSACVLVDDIDAALAVADAWAPSTWRSRPPEPRQLARRVRNAGAIFVGRVRAGLARRLPGRVQPRAADRRHRPAHRRPVGADLPARHPRRRVRRGRALAGVAPHIDALGGAEDLAAHVQRRAGPAAAVAVTRPCVPAARARIPAPPGCRGDAAAVPRPAAGLGAARCRRADAAAG